MEDKHLDPSSVEETQQPQLRMSMSNALTTVRIGNEVVVGRLLVRIRENHARAERRYEARYRALLRGSRSSLAEVKAEYTAERSRVEAEHSLWVAELEELVDGLERKVCWEEAQHALTRVRLARSEKENRRFRRQLRKGRLQRGADGRMADLDCWKASSCLDSREAVKREAAKEGGVQKLNDTIKRLQQTNASLMRQLQAENRDNLRRLASMRSDANKGFIDGDDEEPLPHLVQIKPENHKATMVERPAFKQPREIPEGTIFPNEMGDSSGQESLKRIRSPNVEDGEVTWTEEAIDAIPELPDIGDLIQAKRRKVAFAIDEPQAEHPDWTDWTSPNVDEVLESSKPTAEVGGAAEFADVLEEVSQDSMDLMTGIEEQDDGLEGVDSFFGC